ncbi:putative galactokinase [Actinoplanes missouriensis 431]|uniref:Galactokinase n=1 Tax=Actinoplanes missouriensis (strain ATCC 14538 / DSM 43046 / CBS 188.64 / JCM 3121 / NBRC 102363 / NCIMB 12654 / NRRL B-3342 / UNCC 431) TaxID=512565 RepID=I0HI76_ACTM4|nr:galactokinase [Actinoplanes missouriensis]BAL92713.1 putative galactokinase [Actinoplanes missouriensis 431]
MSVKEIFTAAYGAEPAGVWAAPGRVNLIGEHTDYNDGFVLPFALPQRTLAAAGPSPDDRWHVCSTLIPEPVSFGTTAPGEVTGWGAYVAGVVWALQEAGFEVPTARIAIDSDVPLGSGLSSSAALESAVLTALIDLGGLDLPLEKRPALAQRAENVYVGAPTGIMDQSASIRCQDGKALFLDCRSYEVEQIPFDLAAEGLAILVINSNAPHQHVDGEYGARRKSCEEAAALLGVPALRDVATADLPAALERLGDDVLVRRTRHIVTENQRVLDTVALLRDGRVREVGPLLTASHASMRDDFEITVAQVDVAVEASLAAGAYGARMTGGGFGGCVLALVDADRADATAAAVAGAYAERGFTAPTSWVAVAGPGAARI